MNKLMALVLVCALAGSAAAQEKEMVYWPSLQTLHVMDSWVRNHPEQVRALADCYEPGLRDRLNSKWSDAQWGRLRQHLLLLAAGVDDRELLESTLAMAKSWEKQQSSHPLSGYLAKRFPEAWEDSRWLALPLDLDNHQKLTRAWRPYSKEPCSESAREQEVIEAINLKIADFSALLTK